MILNISCRRGVSIGAAAAISESIGIPTHLSLPPFDAGTVAKLAYLTTSNSRRVTGSKCRTNTVKEKCAMPDILHRVEINRHGGSRRSTGN